MIVEQEYRVKVSEIGQDNKITNKAIKYKTAPIISKTPPAVLTPNIFI